MIPTLKRIRYRASKTHLYRPIIWLRHRGLDARDVFLASYPRSGQHWVRFQLFELLMRQSAEFDSLDSTIPKVGEHGESPSILPSGGRLIQTHEPWRTEYRRAIYLVRDVRDVLLSDYAWEESLGLTKHFDINNLDEYLLPWLKGKVQIMGSWQRHTHSWLNSPLARSGDLLAIRFEDLRRDTEGALAQMVEFLGLRPDRELIREVIRNNSLENMRLKEDRSKKYDAKRLGRQSGEEHRFVRKGSVGGWRERLTDSQIRIIEQYTADALSRVGYPIVTASTPESAVVV
jgi:hypothetical protein